MSKVAIVTGGSKGIGGSTVRSFVANGYHVGILDVDKEAGQRLSDEMGDMAEFFHCDVASTSSVNNSIDAVVDRFG